MIGRFTESLFLTLFVFRKVCASVEDVLKLQTGQGISHPHSLTPTLQVKIQNFISSGHSEFSYLVICNENGVDGAQWECVIGKWAEH